MLALAGTTHAEHMRADIAASNFEISADEVRQIECLATH
jgi:diketogulonate reductase-like aldo/keto reductase